MMNKEELRQFAKKVRGAITPERRTQAQEAFAQTFAAFDRYSAVLSYRSIGSEFDTSNLNDTLARQGKLLLPRIIEGQMRIFRVTDTTQQLECGFCGIMEPIPALCKEVRLEEIGLVIVPALAFDTYRYRIGYGMGCYDRFLSHANPSLVTCGLGFREQLLGIPIPVETHDHPLSTLQLY